ncbi:MAG: hypothetical protein EBT20_14955 [Alphaproteobacteria bacterium]|nr:hypothetical protein [Alphaproteobacteria bacterium]
MDGPVQQRKLRLKKVTTTNALSPLALLTLGACGGANDYFFSGDGGGLTVSGNAIKGPLHNAFVFIDSNENGVWDTGEASDLTDSDGNYSISASATGKLVVTEDPNGTTTDTSTGLALSGFSLSAPDGADVISPMTTLIADGGMTAAQITQGLGLPDGVDPLTYNPYGSGVNAAEALAVEKLAHQVFNVVTSYADSAATVGDISAAAAMEAVASTTIARANAGEVIDLSLSDDLADIQSAAVTKFTAIDSALPATFGTYLDSVSSGLKNVNAQVANADSLTSDAAKELFSLGAGLREQVNNGAQAEKAAAGTGANSVTYKSAAAVTEDAGSAAVKVVEVSGKVLIGPVKSALVWLDKDGDGVLDSNEKYQRTDGDGSFTFSTTSSSPNFAVLLDDSSINMASGTVVGDQNGVPLVSAGGTTVSHITTVMKKAGLTSEQVNAIFDLPDIDDIANFDPYGEGVSAEQATAYLQATHQLAAVADALAALIYGAGTTGATANSKAMTGIASVAENAEAGSFVFDGNAGKANIEALLNSVATEASVQGQLTSALKDAAVDAIYNLTTVIGNVTDFDPETTDGLGKLSNNNNLQFQLYMAADQSDPNLITYKTASNLNDDLTNRPPTDLGFLVGDDLIDIASIKDNASSDEKVFEVGVSDDGSLRRWEIAEIDGTDYAKFVFADAAEDNPRMLYQTDNGDNDISSVNLKLNVDSLDATVKNTYTVVLMAQDDAYKDYSDPLLVVVSETL